MRQLVMSRWKQSHDRVMCRADRADQSPREVAGVFRAQSALDAAVGALLAAGFDRSDIDIMASAEAVRQRLGGIYDSG